MTQTETLEVEQLRYDPLATYLKNAEMAVSRPRFSSRVDVGPRSGQPREHCWALWTAMHRNQARQGVCRRGCPAAYRCPPGFAPLRSDRRRQRCHESSACMADSSNHIGQRAGLDGMPEGLNGFFVTLGYDAVFYTEEISQRIADSSASSVTSSTASWCPRSESHRTAGP